MSMAYADLEWQCCSTGPVADLSLVVLETIRIVMQARSEPRWPSTYSTDAHHSRSYLSHDDILYCHLMVAKATLFLEPLGKVVLMSRG